MCWLTDWLKKKPKTLELPSPKIRLKPEQVEVIDEEDETVSIKVKGYPKSTHVITVAPTNSMEPFIDDGMLVILEPFNGNTSDLIVGDIIDYALPFIINGFAGAFHRIVKIGQDAQGWWCKTKGDNPACVVDPVLVRKEYIRRLYRGVLV